MFAVVSFCAALVLGCLSRTGQCSCDDGVQTIHTPVIGYVGEPVQLHGFLTKPEDMFFHNDQPKRGNDLFFETRKTMTGSYRVVIRYASCTDAGNYCIGGVYFALEIHSNDKMLVYSAQTPKVSIPLTNVINIYKLNPTHYTKVWNVTNRLLDNRCFMTTDNERFVGCDGDATEYYLYDVQTLSGVDCSSTGGGLRPIVPRLNELEHVNTRAETYNISDGNYYNRSIAV